VYAIGSTHKQVYSEVTAVVAILKELNLLPADVSAE
jgi:hypothetical protein